MIFIFIFILFFFIFINLIWFLFFFFLGYLSSHNGTEIDSHPLTFISNYEGLFWSSYDTNVLIKQIIYDRYHKTFVGMGNSPSHIYFSMNAIDWVLKLEGSFTSISIDHRTGLSLACNGSALFKSSDGGWSWKAFDCQNCAAPCNCKIVGYLNEIGASYIISKNNFILLSYDQAYTWDKVYFPYQSELLSLTYGSGVIIAQTANFYRNTIFSSTLLPSTQGLLSIPVYNMSTIPVC